MSEQLNLVVVGHVDHGKSTLIGRLLADTGSLPLGKLESVKANCARNSKPFEYAFLLDALKDEQSQGITIEAARVFFESRLRRYLIMDAPGHVEFLKNMVTGAARADAALLVIDAHDGVCENSKRHGYLLKFLGVSQVLVVINKMDLVNYREDRFKQIVADYSKFLDQIEVKPIRFVPVSAIAGENIVGKSENLKWYSQKDSDSILGLLDQLRISNERLNMSLRLPVQDVYKFTEKGDSRRIIAGTIAAGCLSVGDSLVFYPSGKRSKIKSIEGFPAAHKKNAGAGESVGITLEEQIYVSRGEVAVREFEQPLPQVSTRIRARVFWLGKKPLTSERSYIFKMGTTKTEAYLVEVLETMDASTLGVNTSNGRIERNTVAECELRLKQAVAFDLDDQLPETRRFVLIDDYKIAGGGVVTEKLVDQKAWYRDNVFLRNYKWEVSHIPPELRWQRSRHRAGMLLITGPSEVNKKDFAKKIEAQFFEEGKSVYYVGIGNLLYGLDADLKKSAESSTYQAENVRYEHFRRLGEMGHLLLDAGLILIVTASDVTQSDLEILKTSLSSESLLTVWVGQRESDSLTTQMILESVDNQSSIDQVKELLRDCGWIS